MKILYVLDDDISITSGVVKKISFQTSYWELQGHEVKVISLRSKNLTSCLDNGIILSTLEIEKNIFYKFFKQYNNIKKLKKYLESYSPDVIYLRHMKYYPGISNILKKSAKYVVEINSNDLEESKRNSKVVYFYNKITRGFVLKNASAFISVSKELAIDNIFKRYNKKTLVIGNGYSFNNNLLKKENRNIEVAFIGTPGQEWHGLDKVIKLAAYLDKYKFHIIGSELDDLKKIYKDQIPSNINTHGYLSQEKAEEILLNCSIGISTLALHRNNMNEASPLKSRHYLSLGLPIIIGYEDTDFLYTKDFILNIGNYEDNVNDKLYEIDEFIKMASLLDKNYIIVEAQKVLDYKNKEIHRIDFIKNILKENLA